MNGSQGLYISAMAYEYHTGNTLDYLNIENLMNNGNALQVYDQYQDYINWLEHDGYIGVTQRDNYAGAVIWVGGQHGYKLIDNNIDYTKYQVIVENYPDEIKTYLSKK